MTANYQKTWLADSLNRLAERKAASAIQQTGRALPCSVVAVSGAIVTVKFEVQSGFTLPQVTCPLFGPIYIRYPIQPGDAGMVLPADAYLGGVSGLGGGTANLSRRGNLSTLVFLPISNTAWSAVDPNAVTIYGPNGVVLRDTASNSTFVLTPTSITMVGKDSVSISSAGTSLLMNSTGITITGNVTINGTLDVTENITGGTSGTSVDMLNHTHKIVNIETGSSTINTNPPNAGT